MSNSKINTNLQEAVAKYRAKQFEMKPREPLPTEKQPSLPEQKQEQEQEPKLTLEERIKILKARADRAKVAPTVAPTVAKVLVDNLPDTIPTGAKTAVGMHGEAIEYNAKQREFIDAVVAGESVVLIGAAGTGKSTCTRGAFMEMLQKGKVPVLESDGHAHLRGGTPGIVISSYTRRAVNNIRKVQSEELKHNCITKHKLLEYRPERYEIWDEEKQVYRTTMRFEPFRNADNPLPSTIAVQVMEEASMESVDLYLKWKEAMAHEVQEIFIGDIQQLPPVFGPAILGFKMNELRVIELTEVYRQALESPIIRLAHRILSGKPIPEKEFNEWYQKDEHGSLKLHAWKKKISDTVALNTCEAFFKKEYAHGNYDPEEDMILMPYNKSFGTLELNKMIANFLARERNAITHEIQAGYEKHYFSEGDKILYDKEDAIVIDISPNLKYFGKKPQKPSASMDYHGHVHKESGPAVSTDSEDPFADVDIDTLLESAADSVDDKVNQASHNMTIRLIDSQRDVTLNTAAEFNAIILGYALTVHKSQGSEWRKVYFLSHQSNAPMIQRELLYTAVTRAREELYVICEPDAFVKGIERQRIKGNTLEEKAQQFKGKLPASWNDDIVEKGGKKV